jgi:Tfp pilus assembly protein PilZ
MYFLKHKHMYLGVNGFTTNMTEVYAVSFDNGQIFVPTLGKYLIYREHEATVEYGDEPTKWDLSAKRIIITPDYKALTYHAGLVLHQANSELINHIEGVQLHIPNTPVEELIANGLVFISCKVDTELEEKLRDTPHERVGELLDLDPRFATVLANKRLQNLLQSLFGLNYHLTTFSSNKLLKGVDHRCWHVDYPYHDIQSPYLEHLPALWVSVQVIIPLVDFTEQNGATHYVAGSHHLLRWPEPDHPSRVLTVPKGLMAVYIGSLWHSQGLNMTDTPRSALLANFSPGYIPAKDNIVEQVQRVPTDELRVLVQFSE